jgi:hypothetical protein
MGATKRVPALPKVLWEVDRRLATAWFDDTVART